LEGNYVLEVVGFRSREREGKVFVREVGLAYQCGNIATGVRV
jgi:hypothetical protein